MGERKSTSDRESAGQRNSIRNPGSTSRSAEHSVVIIGTGFAGLGMAIQLKKAGIHDFVLLEKSDSLGGTWRDNTYPGCACDVPSLMYSFSFRQNPGWSHVFARQAEIRDYLHDCADAHRLHPHIRYGRKVTGATWDEDARRWHVRTDDGAEHVGKAVVSGVGALHLPSYPDLPGLDRFTGEVFHSAEWNHDFDLTGKRVAVVGTGASAIQFVPRIAEQVGRLHLFQRTPPWIQPKHDRRISPGVQRIFRWVPGAQRLARVLMYWVLEARFVAVIRSRLLGKVSEFHARRFIRKSIDDPVLAEKVTPRYAMGCKRILLSSDYYPALNRSHVEVETSGVAEVRENSVVTGDGREHPVDAIIHGTGFHAVDAFDDLDIVGRGGRTLREAWRDGMQAHLGITVSGFPNLFFLLGPNTGLGHNSVVFMIESQINYALQCLRQLCAGTISQLDVRQSAQDAFNAEIHGELSGAVWSEGGCRSWYLDENGVNRTLWPGFTAEYWYRTRKVDPAEYEVVAGEG